jgi:response regulator RpfG family c-di-GMP phosphodiesterase
MLRKQRNEFNLRFANGADEALDLTEQHAFDVIVSDITMPEKSGLHLLKSLRAGELTRNIPVVMLTGNAEAGLKRRALDLGATDLLNKPVTAEDLIARLRSVVRLKAYQDELARYNELLEEKVRERTRELEQSRRDLLWRLAKAGEFRDEETGDHVIRVACYTRLLAQELGLDPETTRTLFLTSPLHDIGKIGVPDAILLKAGPLTEGERATMQEHCEIGAAILLQQPKGIRAFLHLTSEIELPPDSVDPDHLRKMAAEIAMNHHERWDGTGYPNNLSGDNIPLSGRIVALADVYDALRSQRPYKRAFTIEETLEIIKQSAGSHFDPQVFDAFTRIAKFFEDIRARFAG